MGVVVALLVARVADLLSDREGLINSPGRYLVFHPGRVGLLLLVVVVVSYGLAWLIARFAPGRGAEVFADSGWYGALERKLPKRHGVLATVELQDGRTIAGVVRAFTAEPTPVDDRELMLAATADSPMLVRTADGGVTSVNDQFVLLRGDEIRYIAGTYSELAASDGR